MATYELSDGSFTIDFCHYTLKLKEFEETSKLLPNEIREFADQALLNVTTMPLSSDTYHQMYSADGKVFLAVYHRLNPYWDSDNYISVGLMPNEAFYLADVYEKYLDKNPKAYVCIYKSRKDFGFPLTPEVIKQLSSSVPGFAKEIAE